MGRQMRTQAAPFRRSRRHRAGRVVADFLFQLSLAGQGLRAIVKRLQADVSVPWLSAAWIR